LSRYARTPGQKGRFTVGSFQSLVSEEEKATAETQSAQRFAEKPMPI
jgi:hypothetical protein